MEKLLLIRYILFTILLGGPIIDTIIEKPKLNKLTKPIEKVISKPSTYNLTIELEDVEYIYGYVGDYVDHWYQIGEKLYDISEKAAMKVMLNESIQLISTSCDCNEKYVDRDDEVTIIKIAQLEKGVNRFYAKVEVYEAHGKYAGNTAEYHFHYKITLSE